MLHRVTLVCKIAEPWQAYVTNRALWLRYDRCLSCALSSLLRCFWYLRVCISLRLPLPFPPLDNIRVIVIVLRLRENIIRTTLCWIMWHNVHSQQHSYVSSSYTSNRLGLLHWDSYAVHRGGCLELYYCNMVEWFWWNSSLIFDDLLIPSVLWHCWFGHLACKNSPRNDLLCVEWDVKPYSAHSLTSLIETIVPFTRAFDRSKIAVFCYPSCV